MTRKIQMAAKEWTSKSKKKQKLKKQNNQEKKENRKRNHCLMKVTDDTWDLDSIGTLLLPLQAMNK